MPGNVLHERFFIDTNIFVYCFDVGAKEKRRKAIATIDYALSSGLGVISHQVIQEFASVALSKFRSVFSAAKLILYCDEVLFPLWRAYPSRESYLTAIELFDAGALSWWDALIAASAIDCGCLYLVSEDFAAESKIKSLEVVDPFR